MRGSLALLTPEKRTENLTKARSGRLQRNAERAASTLRRDFRDMVNWEELARAKHVRLPAWGDPPTPSIMRAFLKRVRVSVEDYLDWAAEPNLKTFKSANPLWSARAWAGLVLEWLAA